ncbi:MAG: hypothetical protein AB1762_20350 [Gemmatimonadota bacterium]
MSTPPSARYYTIRETLEIVEGSVDSVSNSNVQRVIDGRAEYLDRRSVSCIAGRSARGATIRGK